MKFISVAPVEKTWTIAQGAERVLIERQATTVGWAVFAGVDGEEADFVAFFSGSRGKGLAEALVALKDVDQEPVIFSADVAPAILVGSLDDEDKGVFTANHYDHEKGAQALADLYGVDYADFWPRDEVEPVVEVTSTLKDGVLTLSKNINVPVRLDEAALSVILQNPEKT